MITLSGVEKAHGGRILFGDVSLQINRGDRLGLVGPNGAGKTTLFNIILDEESTDAGTVDLQRNLDLGFLPQESLPVNDETVLELALSVRPGFLEARKQILNGEHVEAETYELYNDAGGGQLEAKAKRILGGLSFRSSDFDRPASEMSGGWVMRAHLARLLVQEPDLLMLDEPTNHLDLEALIWVQGYLKNYPGAILMISHDREFLNQLVHGILELRREQLFRWTGNYDSFLQQRDAHESQQLAAHKNQQRQIDHLQTFVDRFGAKNTKATQAKSKQKQIDRLKADLVNAPQGEDRRMKGFHFPQPERSGQRVLTLKGMRFCLRQQYCVHRHGMRGGARPTHRARGAQRRGQIHATQADGRRTRAPSWHARSRAQREGRLFFPKPRGRSEPCGHGFGGGYGLSAGADRRARAYHTWHISL